MLNFTAVLPLPNRSYATPSRGVTSFQFGTPVTSPNVRLRVGTCGPGPIVWAGTMSSRESKRRPALIVIRLMRPLILRRTRPSSASRIS